MNAERLALMLENPAPWTSEHERNEAAATVRRMAAALRSAHLSLICEMQPFKRMEFDIKHRAALEDVKE